MAFAHVARAVLSAGHAPRVAGEYKELLAGEPVDPAGSTSERFRPFETSSPDLQWLTRAIVIGERQPNDVIIHVWKVE